MPRHGQTFDKMKSFKLTGADFFSAQPVYPPAIEAECGMTRRANQDATGTVISGARLFHQFGLGLH